MPKEKKHLEHPESEASFFSGIGVSVILFCIVVGIGIIYTVTKETSPENTPEVNRETISNLDPLPDSPIADIERIHYDSLVHIEGEGNLTFIEYSDMTCEFCQRHHKNVQNVLAEYDGKISYSMKHFPLENTENGRTAAYASECAGMQNNFFTFVHAAFQEKKLIASTTIEDDIKNIVEKENFDLAAFETCLKEETFKQQIDDDVLQALATGATGAPWSIIVDSEGKIITRFKGVIGEKRLKKAIDLAFEEQQKNETKKN